MGTITINVKDETEREFRKIAGAKYGKSKGYLGEAVADALELWTQRERGKNIPKAVEILERGIEMGKLKYAKRADLHGR